MEKKQICFKKVSKTYDGKVNVVEDLDLTVEPGEFLTLLGPSGSGKTTTLMMLAGFEALSSGTILYAGQDIGGLPSHKRNFGFVFQNYALFPHLTIFDNIAFPLRIRRFAKADIAGRVKHALEMVKLPNCEDRYPKELSGGQQQRIALARALVFNPEVVLMDEPLGALDKNLREEMQLELKDMHRRLGVTFVFVTHDQDEALTMSDRVAVFNEGKIVQIDQPKAIYDRPVDPFVAEFVGETNVVLSQVVAESRAGKVRVSNPWFEGDVRSPEVLEKGGQCNVFVRPEHVSISHTRSEAGSREVKVIDLVFRGAYAVLQLQSSDGATMKCKMMASALDSAIAADSTADVYATVNTHHATAFQT